MGTTTISLREEAYERLKARKREGESFSDVVIRLTEEDEDVHVGFGILAGTGIEEAVEETAAEIDEDFQRRNDEMFGQ